MFLRQATAASVAMGPFIDDADGKTFESGLIIRRADVMLSINGSNCAEASAGQGMEDAGAEYLANGDYRISLDAVDTGTLGRLRVSISKAGALPVWREFMVVPAKTFDRVFGSDQLADEMHLVKAALVNARTHVIETGVDEIKDDDGITTLRTLTPGEAGGVVTVTAT